MKDKENSRENTIQRGIGSQGEEWRYESIFPVIC